MTAMRHAIHFFQDFEEGFEGKGSLNVKNGEMIMQK